MTTTKIVIVVVSSIYGGCNVWWRGVRNERRTSYHRTVGKWLLKKFWVSEFFVGEMWKWVEERYRVVECPDYGWRLVVGSFEIFSNFHLLFFVMLISMITNFVIKILNVMRIGWGDGGSRGGGWRRGWWRGGRQVWVGWIGGMRRMMTMVISCLLFLLFFVLSLLFFCDVRGFRRVMSVFFCLNFFPFFPRLIKSRKQQAPKQNQWSQLPTTTSISSPPSSSIPIIISTTPNSIIITHNNNKQPLRFFNTNFCHKTKHKN